MPINASGTFPNGAKFDGPAEFVNVLVSQREEFVRTFADKLLTYALGRGAAYYDQPAIRRIVREAAPERVSVVVGDSGRRQERAVSDADGGDGSRHGGRPSLMVGTTATTRSRFTTRRGATSSRDPGGDGVQTGV